MSSKKEWICEGVGGLLLGFYEHPAYKRPVAQLACADALSSSRNDSFPTNVRFPSPHEHRCVTSLERLRRRLVVHEHVYMCCVLPYTYARVRTYTKYTTCAWVMLVIVVVWQWRGRWCSWCWRNRRRCWRQNPRNDARQPDDERYRLEMAMILMTSRWVWWFNMTMTTTLRKHNGTKQCQYVQRAMLMTAEAA